MATMAPNTDFDGIFRDVLGTPVGVAIEPVVCSLSLLVRRLEALVGSDRWTLQKVRTGDYEARTWEGRVGRGDTATDAIAALVSQLGDVLHAT